MKLYKNGDRCSCCETVLEGKSGEWLRDFSELCFALKLSQDGVAQSRLALGVCRYIEEKANGT